ncbi:hypothetical protein DRO55_01310 [Candidatus Bathyarchaeota archaeon]|nr:MAG: hypothetical protein DRO55_01310 [Candidatus Bathyarchaeota archaeon]
MEMHGRPISPGRAEGVALVSRKPLSFLGGVDPETGVIIEKNHDLRDECVRDRVLCFPHGHGSTVGSYVLYSLVKRGLGPKAIVNVTADPVVVVGAIISEIPMVDHIDIGRISTGDLVEVDGETGMVRVLRFRGEK